MSTKINAREVLSYLNQLGYTNINAVQLQAFIKDLKKLIKYEELEINDPSSLSDAKLVKVNIIREMIDRSLDETRKTSTDALNLNKNEGNTSQSESLSKLIGKENIPNCKSLLERPITVSVSDKQKKSKVVNNFPQSAIVCPVHLLGGIDYSGFPRPKSVGTDCICPVKISQIPSLYTNDKNNKKKKRPVTSTIHSKNKSTGTCSYPESFEDYPRFCLNRKKSMNGSSNYTHRCYCPEALKPRGAVIKCNTECAPPFQKCDPVNLHNYYKRQWKINKIPGENMSIEKRFRWCLRERISCGPPVTLKKPLTKKYDIVLPVD